MNYAESSYKNSENARVIKVFESNHGKPSKTEQKRKILFEYLFSFLSSGKRGITYSYVNMLDRVKKMRTKMRRRSVSSFW